MSGPADLIVEVVSDDSVSRDRVTSFTSIRRWCARIPDHRPTSRLRTRRFLCAGHPGGGTSPCRLTPMAATTLPVLAGFWFEVEWVLSATLPDVLQALAQIVGPEQLLAQIARQAPQPWLSPHDK